MCQNEMTLPLFILVQVPYFQWWGRLLLLVFNMLSGAFAMV
jgi:hypothetical protein